MAPKSEEKFLRLIKEYGIGYMPVSLASPAWAEKMAEKYLLHYKVEEILRVGYASPSAVYVFTPDEQKRLRSKLDQQSRWWKNAMYGVLAIVSFIFSLILLVFSGNK